MAIRILHVISSLGRGGAERQLVDVVSNTNDSQFEHTVCYLQPPDSFAEVIREKGCTVVGLNLSGRRPWISATARLVSLFRRRRPHIIHTRLYDASISARIARLAAPYAPIVTSLEGPDYEPETIRAANWPPLKVDVLRTLDQVSARWSNTFFVACSRFVEQSAKLRLKIPESKIRVIYNSVDPNTLRCEPDDARRLRSLLEIPGDALVYIAVGRLDPPKGHAYLLRAFQKTAANMPKARLVIVGDGPSRPGLEELARELAINDRVRFLGSREDVGVCLEMADSFVFPTLFEGFGIALVEAMFKRLPCIASRVGPIPELIENVDTGILVAPACVEELAAAMSALYQDSARRESLGERAYRSAAHRFHSRVTIPQWERLYCEIIHNGSPRCEAVA